MRYAQRSNDLKNIIAKLRPHGALSAPTARARLADLSQEIFPPDQRPPKALRTLQKEKYIYKYKALY
jgi:hypothetical protein